MKKNGFTLVELLVGLALLGFVLFIGIMSNRKALATSLVEFRNVSDDEIFIAARRYVMDEDVSLKKGYTCVSVNELVDSGYLDNTNSEKIKNRLVKVSVNKVTKVINKVKYVNVCK